VFDSNGDNLDVSFYDASGPTLIGFVAGVFSGTRPLVVWSGIDYSTSFSWYVEVYDGEYLIESDTWEFLTMDEPNDPPYVPSNPDPADGAVEVDVNVDLGWVGGDPDPGDTVTYDIYYGNITPPPKIISNQSEDYYSPGTMNYNTTYYWMIIAWDTHGESSVGPLWSFTTNSSDPPSIPTILSGPSVGGPYVSLNFSVAYTEPSEYDVYYMWDWGDGNMSEWLGPYNSSEPANASYNWSRNETFDVRVKAKNIYEEESGWSYIHSISISKQLFLKNILPGFVYFRLGIFDESYAYIYLLEELRASVVLTRENLIVDVEANESVHTVEFEAYNQIWDEYTTIVDNYSDDGFSAKLINETGLWQLTVFAYDDNGNLIDRESIDFLLSIHFGSQQDPMRRVAKFGQRVKNKILSR